MTEYYVAPDGNDKNPGIQSKPWRSLRHAVSNRSGVSAGDTLFVRGGTYQENVQMGISGKREKPIKIYAYPGENPVIDASTGDGHGFYIPDASNFVELKGLTVRDAREGSGIAMFKVDGIVVDSCTAHGNRRNGIVNTGPGSQCTIRNCTCYDNGAGGGHGQGIYIQDVQAGKVLNCVCYGNSASGIEVNDSNDVVVQGNRCYSNRLAGIDIAGVLKNTLVDQNECSNNGGVGIQVATNEGGGPDNTTVTRNLCYGNLTRQQWGAGIWIARNATNTQVHNNTCCGNRGDANIGVQGNIRGAVSIKSNITSDHPKCGLFVARGVANHVAEDRNCIHEARISWDGKTYTNLEAYRAATKQGAGSIWADPELDEQYQISSSSPCRGAGEKGTDMGYHPLSGAQPDDLKREVELAINELKKAAASLRATANLLDERASVLSGAVAAKKDRGRE